MTPYQKLETLFDDLYQLDHLAAITGWDEAVMMPPGGGQSRAKALAYLSGLRHEKLVHPTTGELIAACNPSQLASAQEQANLALINRQYQFANAVPTKLVKQLSQVSIECEQAWRGMRRDNNWADFFPLLENLFQLSKEAANHKAQALNMSVYNQCLDEFSPGLTQAIIDPIFNQLKETLPGIIPAIVEKQKQRPYQSLKGHYPVEKQKALSMRLMKRIGFDFNHGRFDVSHHPFCGGVRDDIRVTTRFDEQDFTSAVMGICHETGHAMYEMGLPKDKAAQPVGHALGMSLHESQSLLIEMQVCRSKAFMQIFQQEIEQTFGKSDAFSIDNLVLHYTQVKPGYIRVDADELTYPLHIILRYEIEKALFNDEIAIKDLPDIWHSKMQAYLGQSTEDNYANGVMQDVHWPAAAFGYFPAYTIGALIAAQLYSSAQKDQPNIPVAISKGDFKPLNHWLRKQVHNRGSEVDFQRLLIDATGEPLNADYYMDHIKHRYDVSL